MRKLLWLSVLLADILLLIACDEVKNPGEIEYEVNHWPNVKTLEITNITDTSVSLNATVNAFNLKTTVAFEYGTTTNYGNTVAADQSPVTGDSIKNVSAIISDLLPCAMYHFRAKAENSVWKNFYGSDKTFVLPVVSDIPIQTCTNYTSGNSGLPSDCIGPIIIDENNNIWIASFYYSDSWEGPFLFGSGVTKFDGTNWTTYTTADGLAGNMVLSIAIDAQGNKWFGTDTNGVSKFDGTNWTTYTTAYGLANNHVSAIAIDAQGNKWFGTGGGVSKFDGTSWTTYTTEDGLVNNQIKSIAIDAEGNKWIGTLNGISKFDGKTWTNYNLSSKDYLNMISSIAIDAQGSKWFGMVVGGMRKFDGTNWTTFNLANDCRYPNVTSTVIDAQDNKWFGMEDGVAKTDGKKWTTYTTANGARIHTVNSIAIDSEGNKWLGTAFRGVLKLSSEFK